MPQKLFDWLQLPTWGGVEPYRRMLADVLGFPATPVYDTKDDEAHTSTKTEQPKLLTANVRTSPNSPRKKRRNKKRKRDRGRGR